jgi:NifU-like protein involved in Fe-S cluster formation
MVAYAAGVVADHGRDAWPQALIRRSPSRLPYMASRRRIPYIGENARAWAMLSDIYNRRILELAADIPRLGRLAAPQASATAHSKLCGSTVTVDVVMADGRVADFGHEVKACALGQAASSIMARAVIGATPDELREARDSVKRMLKESGQPPSGRFADAAVLEPVRDFKARHASTLLAFDAVVEAVGKIEAAAA